MPAPFDLDSIDRLLTTTRSVRKRLDLDAPVDLEEIQHCIGLACQAPTGGNVQDWRWLVVTDPDKRAALAELYNRAAVPYFKANRENIAARGITGFDGILSSSEHLAEVLHRVPVHIIPCILGRPEGQDVFALTSWYGRMKRAGSLVAFTPPESSMMSRLGSSERASVHSSSLMSCAPPLTR